MRKGIKITAIASAYLALFAGRLFGVGLNDISGFLKSHKYITPWAVNRYLARPQNPFKFFQGEFLDVSGDASRPTVIFKTNPKTGKLEGIEEFATNLQQSIDYTGKEITPTIRQDYSKISLKAFNSLIGGVSEAAGQFPLEYFRPFAKKVGDGEKADGNVWLQYGTEDGHEVRFLMSQRSVGNKIEYFINMADVYGMDGQTQQRPFLDLAVGESSRYFPIIESLGQSLNKIQSKDLVNLLNSN